MKTLLIAIFTLTATFISAQNTVEWIGGTPGKQSDWNEPKNWSNHKVPDVFSNVIIPNVSSTTLSSPIIPEGIVEINSLTINAMGELVVEEEATLIVYSEASGADSEEVIINGELKIVDEICFPLWTFAKDVKSIVDA